MCSYIGCHKSTFLDALRATCRSRLWDLETARCRSSEPSGPPCNSFASTVGACYVGYFKWMSKSVQVLFNGIEAVVELTLIILKWRALSCRGPQSYRYVMVPYVSFPTLRALFRSPDNKDSTCFFCALPVYGNLQILLMWLSISRTYIKHT